MDTLVVGKIIVSALFATGLFAGMLASLRVGWWIGKRRFQMFGENGQAGLGALEAGVYGLMGLLIAFTFTGAATRFHARRDVITSQINAIGTAWLRLDLLTSSARDEVRTLFRRYVDTQMDIVTHVNDRKAMAETTARLAAIQGQIWTRVMEEVKTDRLQPLAQTVLPPLNDMFDLSTTRLLATRQHPPFAIFAMLGLLVLLSALMAGFGMAKSERQSPLHVYGFAAIIALAVYLILDLEYPRLGLVRIDTFDQSFVELRATMEE